MADQIGTCLAPKRPRFNGFRMTNLIGHIVKINNSNRTKVYITSGEHRMKGDGQKAIEQKKAPK